MQVAARYVQALGLTVIITTAGCKSGGSSSGLREELASPAGTADFCLSPDATRDSLKSLTAEQWAGFFAKGIANKSVIPGFDHPNVQTTGKGFPLIFPTSFSFLNRAANHLWDGKTMLTDAQGDTHLYNRFIEATENVSVNLFTAKVVMDDHSKLVNNDGKPVILLDYRQSKLTDAQPEATNNILGHIISGIDQFVVPGISAIRDEIRLVCQTTDATARHRLYLGPTVFLPEMLDFVTREAVTTAGLDVNPVLWFALEFSEPVTAAGATAN